MGNRLNWFLNVLNICSMVQNLHKDHLKLLPDSQQQLHYKLKSTNDLSEEINTATDYFRNYIDPTIFLL